MITGRLHDEELEQVKDAGSHLFPSEFVQGEDFHTKLNVETVRRAHRRRIKAAPDQQPGRQEGILDELRMIRKII